MTLWRPGMAITADRLNGVIMDWTPLTNLGAWQPLAAPHDAHPPMMLKRSDGGGTVVWEFQGEIEIPSLATGSIIDIFRFDPPHRVSTASRRFACGWNQSGFYPPWARFNTDGWLATGFASAASTGANTRLSLDRIRITNP